MSIVAAPRPADPFSQAMSQIIRPRTAAATEARQVKHAQRLASDLAPRADRLPNDYLAALAGVLTAECLARGLAVPDLR